MVKDRLKIASLHACLVSSSWTKRQILSRVRTTHTDIYLNRFRKDVSWYESCSIAIHYFVSLLNYNDSLVHDGTTDNQFDSSHIFTDVKKPSINYVTVKLFYRTWLVPPQRNSMIVIPQPQRHSVCAGWQFLWLDHWEAGFQTSIVASNWCVKDAFIPQ